jgi:hypothetical protein
MTIKIKKKMMDVLIEHEVLELFVKRCGESKFEDTHNFQHWHSQEGGDLMTIASMDHGFRWHNSTEGHKFWQGIVGGCI